MPTDTCPWRLLDGLISPGSDYACWTGATQKEKDIEQGEHDWVNFLFMTVLESPLRDATVHSHSQLSTERTHTSSNTLQDLLHSRFKFSRGCIQVNGVARRRKENTQFIGQWIKGKWNSNLQQKYSGLIFITSFSVVMFPFELPSSWILCSLKPTLAWTKTGIEQACSSRSSI
jgi:hypothetical protein